MTPCMLLILYLSEREMFCERPSLQRWVRTGLSRTGSGLKLILAGLGLDPTAVF